MLDVPRGGNYNPVASMTREQIGLSGEVVRTTEPTR